MSKKKFHDKVVLITGASSGIGRALALEFSQQGAKVVLIARRKKLLNELAAEIKRFDGTALVLPCNINDDKELLQAVRETNEKLGTIDIAVANAAIPMHGNFYALSLSDYRQIMETNVFGVLRTAYACLPNLKEKSGTLVIMGSSSGYISFPGSSAYAMSKFAIRAFAEAVHNELAEQGIHVVLITPGFVESEIRMVDNKGIYHPEWNDWVPSWMVMPAEKAAGKMARAIYRRKREKFITTNGYLGYWIRQYMPWLYFSTLNLSKKWKFTHRK
jgi:short-subunit dehydrogenase